MNDLLQFVEALFCLEECVEFRLTSFGTLKHDCVIKLSEMLIFLPLINSSVTTRLNFISNHIIKNY